ncbi:E3 ubiquitin-protein ligase RNF138-like [Discoglossus pictus]
MAEANSSSPDYLDEDFYCPVCQEVLQTPVKTINCEHIFCRKCFLTAMKTSGAHCPLCRSPVKKKERFVPTRAANIEAEMRTRSGHCKCCGKLVKYHLMRRHYKTCWEYQEEFGTPKEKDHLKLLPLEDSAGNSNRTEGTNNTSESGSLEGCQENSPI